VLANLRQVTHLSHVRLNQHPMLQGLTKQGYPLNKYKQLLVTYSRIYLAIEQQLDIVLPLLDGGFDYATRRKLPWLLADLEYFGLDNDASEQRIQFSVANNPGAAVGILYAIEGATLGGQIISAHLHDTLGLTAHAGARFFNGYGDSAETKRRWDEFGILANAAASDPILARSAEIAALGVFELIEKQLNECNRQFEE